MARMTGQDLKDHRLTTFRLTQTQMASLFEVSVSTYKAMEAKEQLKLMEQDCLMARFEEFKFSLEGECLNLYVPQDGRKALYFHNDNVKNLKPKKIASIHDFLDAGLEATALLGFGFYLIDQSGQLVYYDNSNIDHSANYYTMDIPFTKNIDTIDILSQCISIQNYAYKVDTFINLVCKKTELNASTAFDEDTSTTVFEFDEDDGMITVTDGQKAFKVSYDSNSNSYIVINGFSYEDASTAFDFEEDEGDETITLTDGQKSFKASYDSNSNSYSVNEAA